MKTKFGNVRINKYGYYRITSRKEGNFNKLLHRLIWENYYGKPVPEGYDIHHINGDKLDNRIQNLQCVEHSKHVRFHMKGKKFSEEHKKKLSEAKMGKYTIWNASTVYYQKYKMFHGGREPNPCKCFQIKYNRYKIPIGYFHDFVSCEIINNLILDAIEEGSD